MDYNYYSEIPSQQLNQQTSVNNTTTNTSTNNYQDNKVNQENKKDLNYFNKIKFFLLTPTGTLLTVAFGIAIGNTFRDFISSFVTNILEPILILIISKTYLNDYYNLSTFISPQENVINIKLFLSSFITFILVLITVYIIHNTFTLSL